MSIKSLNKPAQFIVLQNAPLSSRLKEQLEKLKLIPLLSATSLEEALAIDTEDQVYILSENRICLYQRQLNFMESFPPESLGFILSRQNEGGRH
jgi:hypothetical protein